MWSSEPGQPGPGVAPPVVGSMPYWARVLIGRANHLSPSPGFTEEDMMTVWERCEGRWAVSLYRRPRHFHHRVCDGLQAAHPRADLGPIWLAPELADVHPSTPVAVVDGREIVSIAAQKIARDAPELHTR